MEKIQEIVFQNDNEEINTIRCDICRNFLSFPPILHNDALGSVCGRDFCVKMANSKGINYRQRAYEALARYLKFPCMNMKNGCCEVLSWDKIGEHEKTCAFDTSSCPFSSNRFEQLENEVCPWTGKISELLEHMDEVHHSPHKFENYVEIHFGQETKKTELFFSRIEESIVILLLITDGKSFQLKVWSGLEIWDNIKYNIRFSTHIGYQRVFPKMQSVELIHPKFFESKVDDTWIKMDLAFIRKMFDCCDPLTIEFYFDGFLMETPQKIEIDGITSLPILGYCEICRKPGFIFFQFCEKRHNLCGFCGRRNECILCERKLSILDKLKFFINKSLTTCILCWDNVDCLSSHIFNIHKKSIMQLDQFYTISLNCATLHLFFSYDDKIFLLSCSSDNINISFNVECLESIKIKYKYDLKLISKIEMPYHAAITYSDFCLPGNSDLYSDARKQFLNSIPVNWLIDFIPVDKGKEISIKLSISRI